MEAGIIGAAISAVALVVVTGLGAIIRLQMSTLDRMAAHHEEFVAFRAASQERLGSLESRVHEQDRVSLSRALEQVMERR